MLYHTLQATPSQMSTKDEEEKYLISGYYRTIRQMGYKDTAYYNTPPLVVHLTILYHYIAEYFAKCGYTITINQARDTIDRNNGHNTGCTAYGNVDINSSTKAIYKWKFEILSNPRWEIITFGIDSSNQKFINSIFYVRGTHNNSFYAYETRNGGGGTITSDDNKRFWYGQLSKEGDIVTMELDTINRTIKFYHNTFDLGIMYDNIDLDNNKTYNMAICLFENEQSVKLTYFSQRYK